MRLLGGRTLSLARPDLAQLRPATVAGLRRVRGATMAGLRSSAHSAASSASELLGGNSAGRPALGVNSVRLARVFGGRANRVATPERVVPIAVCTLLVMAALVSALPPVAAVGSDPTNGGRVVVDGLIDSGDYGYYDPAAEATPVDDIALPNILQQELKAVDGSSQLKVYTVKGRDTLNGIARKFGISPLTLYWANEERLPDPEMIRVGQHLLIPAIDGLVVVVATDDTLQSLADKYKVSADSIVEANSLTDTTLVIGQKLIIPGVSAGAMPTPKPIVVCSGSNCQTIVRWTGGRLRWPVAGKSQISQYFHYGHPAIDISASSGQPVVAAASGTVIFAGWKSSGGGVGGGNVVWISHGGKLYTTYNHLSVVYVHVGQRVSSGRVIGAIGATGMSTGPHLHFEVWVCYPWYDYTTSCTRNPLYYLR
jgi:murein DD-endopeptidase MepM/ murein hydrolase activator NlpD